MAVVRAGALPQPERIHISPVEADAAPSTSFGARQPNSQSFCRARRADLSTRRRHSCLLQCHAVNRGSWQTLSQLEPTRPLDLELVPACHAAASTDTVVLHPLQHTLITRNGHASNIAMLSHSSGDSESSYSQQGLPVAPQGDMEDADLKQELYDVQDFTSLEHLVQLNSHRMSSLHIRAALIRLMQLHTHLSSASQQQQQQNQQHPINSVRQHRQAAHSCLQRVCQCWPHAGISNLNSHAQSNYASSATAASSSNGSSGGLVVGSWSPRDLVLLAKVMCKLEWYHELTWRQLCSCVGESVYSLPPRDASTMLWAAARFWRLHPGTAASALFPLSPSDLTLLAERVWAGAGYLPPASIAQALHSLASLRHLPPQPCIDGLITAGLLRRVTDWQGGDLACVMWALATLGAPPSRDLCDAVLQQSERAMRSFGTGASLATMLWALASMGRAPPRPWMEHYLWQVQRRVSTCDAQTISMIMWSLAKLRYRPPQAWAAAVLRAAGQRMHSPTPQSHTAVQQQTSSTPATTSAASGPQPAAAVVAVQPAEGTASAAVEVPASLVNAQLPHQGGTVTSNPDWIGRTEPETTVLWPPGEEQRSLAHNRESINTSSSGDHSSVIGASSDGSSKSGGRRLWQSAQQHGDNGSAGPQLHRPQPPPHQLSPSQPVQPATSMDGLHQPAWQQPQQSQQSACGPMRLPPPSHPLQPATAQFSQQPQAQQAPQQQPPQGPPVPLRKGPGASPRTFATYLWALARLQLLPRATYLQRLCAAMGPGLGSFAPGELALTLWALQTLRHTPEPHWMAACSVALKARLPAAGAHSLLTAMHALAGYTPIMPVSEDLYHILCYCLTHRLPTLTTDQIASACSSLSRIAEAPLLPAPPAQLTVTLSRLVLDQLPAMRLRDMATAALGLARLAARHGGVPALMAAPSGMDTAAGGVMQRVTVTMKQRLAECCYKDLIQVAVACSLAGHHPGPDWLHAHEVAVSHLVNLGQCTPLELLPLLTAYEDLGHHPARLHSAAGGLRARAVLQQRTASAVAAAANDQQARSAQAVQQPHAGTRWGSEDANSWPHPTEQQQLLQQQSVHAVLLAATQLSPEHHALRRELLCVNDAGGFDDGHADGQDDCLSLSDDTNSASSVSTKSLYIPDSNGQYRTPSLPTNRSTSSASNTNSRSNSSSSLEPGVSNGHGAGRAALHQQHQVANRRSFANPASMRITLGGSSPARSGTAAGTQPDSRASTRRGGPGTAMDGTQWTGQWQDLVAGDAAWPSTAWADRGQSPQPASDSNSSASARQKDRQRRSRGMWRAQSTGPQH